MLVGLGTADAEPLHWHLSLESGAEYDSNIHRFENSDGDCPSPPDLSDPDCLIGGALLLRGVARLAVRWRPGESQRIRISGLGGGKLYGPADLDSSSDENVRIVSGDIRYQRMLRSRGAILAARASYYDTSPLGHASPVEPRHFATGGADMSLSVQGPDRHRLVLSGGYRQYRLKISPSFDWRGDRYSLRYQTTEWLGDPNRDLDAASIELAVSYAIARRYYGGSVERTDIYHSADAQLVYTGDRVYSARYQLHVIDSNGYGDSLIRQRIHLGITAELFAELFLTVEANLQFDRGSSTASDPMETIDDENRSSLTAHASKALSDTWSVEVRYALFVNELRSVDPSYRRQIIYAGMVYQLSR